jgi:hypothetical protein
MRVIAQRVITVHNRSSWYINEVTYWDPIGSWSAVRYPGVRADGPPSDNLLPG